ncbi:MAG: hypothetical protein IJE97_00635 [Thermoguttaceae bacterium]|nr:hypothetical protein [Thermoguttaceae bacterium]
MKKRFNDFVDRKADADASDGDLYLRPARDGRPGRFGRFFRRTALVFALLFVALVLFGAFYYWRGVSAPIDAENASPAQIAGWLAFRDLSAETSETRERLFDRCVETLGGEDGVVEPEKLELSPQARRIARAFFQREEAKRQEEKQEAEKRPVATAADRAPYLRLDYYVAPRSADSPNVGEYVVSDDVRPGPALLERWKVSRENAPPKKSPAVEKNVRLFAMQWFVAKRKAYDAAPDAEKERRLQATVDELLGWQEFYSNLRADATKTKTSRSEMLREFEKIVESWNEFEEPEELAKTLWFKDLIVARIAAQESPFGRFSPSRPPRARQVSPSER